MEIPLWESGQKSMQRPAFSQSPYRVGSGPSRPPISRFAPGAGGWGAAVDSAGVGGAGGGVSEALGAVGDDFVIFNRRVCQIADVFTTDPMAAARRIERLQSALK
jgi:hypothetical protein